MKRKIRALAIGAGSVAAAAVALTAALPAHADTTAANPIVNPGFESLGFPGWDCTTNGSGAELYAAHSGFYGLYGRVTDSENGECSQTVTVSPDTTYRLSAWVNGKYVFLGARATDGDADESTFAADTHFVFQQESVVFSTGSSTSVTVYVHGWPGQGTYYADDFDLQPVS